MISSTLNVKDHDFRRVIQSNVWSAVTFRVLANSDKYKFLINY